MAEPSIHLQGLSACDQPDVAAWLADFATDWNEQKLSRAIERLPPADSPLRRPILLGMIRTDLHHHRQRGVRASLETYLVLFPELGTPDNPPQELIEAERDAGPPAEAAGTVVEFSRRPAAHAAPADPSPAAETPAPMSPAVGETVLEASPQPSPPLAISLPAVPRVPEPAENAPQKFGRYRLLRTIGKGGMGTVFLAHDEELDRSVALKVPHIAHDDGPDVLERFKREARAAAVLHHPNICPVFDVGEQDGVPFLTMAYIEGKPLGHLIKSNRHLPQRQAAEIVRQIALAMQQAHQRGIVHRDLKPANIHMNEAGEPVVMDFGVARRIDKGGERLTHNGQLVGTPEYMAPEQARGDLDAIGPASDIYSLGVILYRLLTGRLPYEGRMMDVLVKLITEKPTPASTYRPDLDPRLEEICEKAMARKIEDRYASMTEFATALNEYMRDMTQVEVPVLQASSPDSVTVATGTESPVAGKSPAPSLAGTSASGSSLPVVLPGKSTAPSLVDKPPPARRGIPSALMVFVLGGLLAAAAYGAAYWLAAGPTAQPTNGSPATTVSVPKATTLAVADEKRSQFEKARAAFDRKDYGQAIAHLDAVLQLDREDGPAYRLRGQARALNDDLPKAIDDFTTALRYPDQHVGETYRLRGLAHLDNKDDAKAIQDLTAALQRDTKDTAALVGRARASLRQKDYARTIEDCKAAQKLEDSLKLDSLLVQAYTAQGQGYLEQKDFPKAEFCFKHANLIEPNNETILVNLGNTYLAQKDWERAIENYTQAARLKPLAPAAGKHLADAYDGLLKKYLDAKEYAKALEYLDGRSKVDAGNPWLRWQRGKVLLARGEAGEAGKPGDTELAIEDLTQAVESKSFASLLAGSPELSAAVGRLLDEVFARYSDDKYFRRRNFKAAITDFTQRLDRPGQKLWAYNGRGRAYHMNGDYPFAVDDFKEGLTVNPQHALTLRYLGDTYAELKQMKEAGAAFAEALKLNPDDLRNWSQYLHWLLQKGDLAEYRKKCEELLKQFGPSKDPLVLNPVAWACALIPDAVADLRQPVQLARKALELGDERSDIFVRNTLSATLYRAGLYKEANTELQEIAKIRQTRKDSRANVNDYLFQAMTCQRLKQTDDAKMYLKAALTGISEELKSVRLRWDRRVELEALSREAEDVVKGGKP